MSNYLKNKYYTIILSNEKFKGIFLLCIFGSFISSFDLVKTISYEEAILSYFSSNLCQLFLFTILFITSIITFSIFEKNKSIVIRYKNKSIYLNNLFKTISIINFIVYLQFVTLGLTILTFKYFDNLSFSYISSYQIPFIVYNIYSIIKYFFIINMIIIICILIYKLLNKLIGGSSFIFFLILKDMYPYSIESIDNIFNIKLFFGYYLYPFEYSSFLLEIICFGFIFFCFFCLSKLLKKIILDKKIFIDC